MTDEYWPTAEGRLSGRVDLDGREMIMLSSNDYLGLAGDERVLAGAHRALDAYGAGLGLNPSIALTRVHRELADELAAFLGCESVLLFNSCAAANCATLQTLADSPEATIVSDEYNHASIVDGCRLARGRTRVYRHDDLDSLEQVGADLTGAGRTLLVTDGVFSMEGSIARLDQLEPLVGRLGAELVVDDSHGIGVIGRTGRGSVEHHGPSRPCAPARSPRRSVPGWAASSRGLPRSWTRCGAAAGSSSSPVRCRRPRPAPPSPRSGRSATTGAASSASAPTSRGSGAACRRPAGSSSTAPAPSSPS